jgi:hypothetical protein
MIESIIRCLAILLMLGVMVGAGQIVWWLASAWFPSGELVPLSVQAFDVSHGEKVEKEEGKHLATLLVKQIQYIQSILSADLSKFGGADQVIFESVVPKNLYLAPEVSVKIDMEVKAFDMDVIGIFEKLYKFFDRSDRLEVSMWINENVKLFGVLKTHDNQRIIGPWWLDKQEDEQAAVETLANLFALDLYKTQVRGLRGLDAKSFAIFVNGLHDYHEHVKIRQSKPNSESTKLLQNVGDLFQKLAEEGKASAIVYSYLGNVRSLQNQSKMAIDAYTEATKLNPNDAFAVRELKRLQAAEALQPVPTAEAAPTPGLALESLKNQKLPDYDADALPPPQRDIAIAVIGTGITPELSKALGPRLVDSSSTVPNEPDTDDHLGHGTSVTALAAALAPSAKIISIKSLSASGAGSMEWIAEGIRLATKQRANLILLPLGSPTSSTVIEAAVTEALEAGVLVIAAAGNDGSDQPGFPARQAGVLAVGALDKSGKVAHFSSRGPGVLYAPGTEILVLGLGGELVTQSGTSFSATVASGIAAVVWSVNPDYSAEQIRERLNSTSTDLGPVDPGKPLLGEVRQINATAAWGPANL